MSLNTGFTARIQIPRFSLSLFTYRRLFQLTIHSPSITIAQSVSYITPTATSSPSTVSSIKLRFLRAILSICRVVVYDASISASIRGYTGALTHVSVQLEGELTRNNDVVFLLRISKYGLSVLLQDIPQLSVIVHPLEIAATCCILPDPSLESIDICFGGVDVSTSLPAIISMATIFRQSKTHLSLDNHSSMTTRSISLPNVDMSVQFAGICFQCYDCVNEVPITFLQQGIVLDYVATIAEFSDGPAVSLAEANLRVHGTAIYIGECKLVGFDSFVLSALLNNQLELVCTEMIPPIRPHQSHIDVGLFHPYLYFSLTASLAVEKVFQTINSRNSLTMQTAHSSPQEVSRSVFVHAFTQVASTFLIEDIDFQVFGDEDAGLMSVYTESVIVNFGSVYASTHLPVNRVVEVFVRRCAIGTIDSGCGIASVPCVGVTAVLSLAPVSALSISKGILLDDMNVLYRLMDTMNFPKASLIDISDYEHALSCSLSLDLGKIKIDLDTRTLALLGDVYDHVILPVLAMRQYKTQYDPDFSEVPQLSPGISSSPSSFNSKGFPQLLVLCAFQVKLDSFSTSITSHNKEVAHMLLSSVAYRSSSIYSEIAHRVDNQFIVESLEFLNQWKGIDNFYGLTLKGISIKSKEYCGKSVHTLLFDGNMQSFKVDSGLNSCVSLLEIRSSWEKELTRFVTGIKKRASKGMEAVQVVTTMVLHIEHFDMQFAFYDAGSLRINSDSLEVSNDPSSELITLFTSTSIQLNGIEFVNFDKLKLGVTRYRGQSPDIGRIPRYEFESILLEFGDVMIYVQNHSSMAEFMEWSQVYLDAFKSYTAELLGRAGDKNPLPRTYDFKNLRVSAIQMRVFVEQSNVERAESVKRFLSQSDMLRKAELNNYALYHRVDCITPPDTSNMIAVLKEFNACDRYRYIARIVFTEFKLDLSVEPDKQTFESWAKFVADMDSCPLPPFVSLNDDPVCMFQKLWLRRIHLDISTIDVSMGDLSMPVLISKRAIVTGLLSQAQVVCPYRYRSKVGLELRKGTVHTIEVGTSVRTKLYHDVNIVMDSVEVTHGYCWNASISMFNRALDRMFLVTLPGQKVLGRPLEWWNKLRLKYHGKAKLLLHNSTLRVLATSSPYSTECIEIIGKQWIVDYTTGKFKFDICNYLMEIVPDPLLNHRTMMMDNGFNSVYMGCYPDRNRVYLTEDMSVKITLILNWAVSGSSPFDHHCLQDTTPKLDVYEDFRAKKLDIGFEMDIVSAESTSPYLWVWAEDYRWIDQLSMMLTMPTKVCMITPLSPDLERPLRSRSTLGATIDMIEMSFTSRKMGVCFMDWIEGLGTVGIQWEAKSCEFFYRMSRDSMHLWEYKDYSLDIMHTEVDILDVWNNPAYTRLSGKSCNPFLLSQSKDINEIFYNKDELTVKRHIYPESIHFFTFSELSYLYPNQSDVKRIIPSTFRRDRLSISIASPRVLGSVAPRFSSTLADILSASNSPVAEEYDVFLRERKPSDPHSSPTLDDVADEDISPIANDVHGVRLVDLKMLWTHSLRCSFGVWWKYIYHTDSTDKDSSSSIDSDDVDVSDDLNGLSTTGLMTSTEFHYNADVPSTDLSALHSLLKPKSLAHHDSALSSVMDEDVGVAPIVDVEGYTRLSLASEQLDSHNMKPRVCVDIVRPQLNLQSARAKGRVVLIASAAYVRTGDYIYPEFEDIDQFELDAEALSDVKRLQGFMYKHSVSAILKTAQFLVAQTDIDSTTRDHWVPRSHFRNLEGKSRGTVASSQRLRAITAPTEIAFSYIYDSIVGLVSNQVEQQEAEFVFRTANRSSAGLNDESKLRVEHLIPTSSAKLNVGSLDCTMDGQQFYTLVHVLNNLVIEPIESTWSEITVPVLPDIDMIKAEVERLINISNSGNDCDSDAIDIEEVVVRNVEYELGRIVWTLVDPMAENRQFIHATLSDLHGAHQFLRDSRNVVHFDMGDVLFTDEVHNKRVLAPEAERWAQRDPQTKAIIFEGVAGAPLEGGSAMDPVLKAVTVWERLELKVFPLSIEFDQGLYQILRRYFIDSQHTLVSASQEDFFDDSLSVVRKHRRSMTAYSNSKSEVKSSKLVDHVTVPAMSYFMHLRFNQTEINLTFSGTIAGKRLNFSQEISLHTFQKNYHLWTQAKLLSKFESHVIQCLVWLPRAKKRRGDNQAFIGHRRKRSTSSARRAGRAFFHRLKNHHSSPEPNAVSDSGHSRISSISLSSRGDSRRNVIIEEDSIFHE